tara:strand:+ start:183 stop:839 length:657 start_codon:yes stop_codon:yes gene_type:complete
MTLYEKFTQNFEKAVLAAKRDKSEIEIIAVSKKKSVDDIKKILHLNHLSFGENQIQEVERKWSQHLRKLDFKTKLHFIGGIQSRKVRSIHEHCDLIHSLDRMKLVKSFSEVEKMTNHKKKYFIQINTGNEPQKSGVILSEADEFISHCLSDFELDIIGLMCLPPSNEDPKKHFKILKSIRDNFNLPYLSMGMTDDYEAAIDCGSTHIRIGRDIFGERS